MNRHQVLTGACNPGENCYAVGSVEGIHFTAYAAGCNIAILAGNFERVQIIPGVTHGNIKVTCIDCSTDTGKIAASYGKKVYIFEPTPIAADSSHKLDYRWYKTAEIETECYVNSLSWNMEGSKLLTGGDLIQIWQFMPKNKGSPTEEEREEEGSHKVLFHLGGGMGSAADPDDDGLSQRICHAVDPQHYDVLHNPGVWECVWKTKPATPVYHLQFSPDGFLFASAGKADRLVKIWYEDLKVQQGLARADSLSPRRDVLHYSFIYIAHPRAVTGFTWRKTSKYMPRGAVANILVTSCMDNVSRIWVETILPDDGSGDLDQFDPTISHDPKHFTQRHKKRFVQRLKTIRHAIHKRKKPKYGPETVMSSDHLNSMNSVHDFHRFAIHHSGVSPVLHFHLACSINPETVLSLLPDLPLQPLTGNTQAAHSFRVHWLNNKELQFTMEAEKLLQELHAKLQSDEGVAGSAGGGARSTEGEDSDGGDGGDGELEADENSNREDQWTKKLGRGGVKKQQKGERLGHHTESQDSMTSEEEHSSAELNPSILERLDRNIELLLKNWQCSADMLFSIHPVDGSFLVWLVDWLDEVPPVSFRQPQVSFSSRLPKAFPVPDASTMACNVLLYCNYSRMDIKSAMKISEGEVLADGDHSQQGGVGGGAVKGAVPDNMLIPNVLLVTKHHNGSLNQWQVSFTDTSKFQTVASVAHAARVCGHRFRANAAACHPVLPLLLTTSHHNLPDPNATPERETPTEETDNKNHSNSAGSFAFCSELILWQVGHVGPLSKSGGLVELARINSPNINAFTSMAWVPTLLPSTTLGSCNYSPSTLFVASDGNSLRLYQAVIDARLLLTEAQGPKKGNFGTSFSSASSSFVQEPPSPKTSVAEAFNMVSLQSSARPGCLLELERINDAMADWQNIQLLHVFQEALVVDHRSQNLSHAPFGASGFGDTMSAFVDLSSLLTFEENFYLVVLERLSSKMGDEGSRLHMWKITASSQPSTVSAHGADAKMRNGSVGEEPLGTVPPYDSDEEAATIFQASQNPQGPGAPSMKMSITTVKVCTQTLSLPTGVSVISANVAAGHLGSASIYPACFAPYLLATACSDGQVRFWKCCVQDMELRHDNPCSVTSYEFCVDSVGGRGVQPSITSSLLWKPQEHDYLWEEWQMACSKRQTSAVSVPGKPITVSCAYSGRMAVAYRRSDVQAQPNHPEEKFVNLYVAIYECESTGGSEWVLEDTIELQNIKIPDPQAEIELSQAFSSQPVLPPGLSIYSDPFTELSSLSPNSSTNSMHRIMSVPSLSTLQSVRKSISEQGNRLGLLRQKCLVQLDWVSTEDGTHILTVGVGTKILAYCQVSNEVAQASIKANAAMSSGPTDAGKKPDMFPSRPKGLLQKSKSLAVDDYKEEIRWMKLRAIDLETADGLPPLPMHISWVRGGILVVGMDNEFHVYTQWRGGSSPLPAASSVTAGSVDSHQHTESLTMDKRTLTEANLASMASTVAMSKTYKSMSNFKSSLSMAKHAAANSMNKREVLKKPAAGAEGKSSSLARSDSTSSLCMMHDFGLFEAARLANPVLPQYHPEQLKALLTFGKIRRVKAILAHLLRCIIGSDNMQSVFADGTEADDSMHRSTRLRSVSGTDDDTEVVVSTSEDSFEFMEINSIPPLPIYALMAADADNTGANLEIVRDPGSQQQQQDYKDLFSTPFKEEVLDLSDEPPKKRPISISMSNSPQQGSPYAFTPAHSKVLSRQLMRISLPGLSSLDQMYLVAMADTVAHCKMDFADCFAESKEGSLANDSQADVNQATESMDDCGLRFVLAMRQHIYLLTTLPQLNRLPLQRQGLRSYSLVWAFHSEANEELLSMIPCMQKDDPQWDELRQFGVGWWLTNTRLLRQLMERVAKCAFQRRKDPMDAAIFYLSMRKKNVLWGLFRSADNRQKADFFRKDFTKEESRRLAKKNAFHLMGKQKFYDAAALFLLADSLHDAVMVILDKLNDFQLALVVCRLYEIDDPLPQSVCQLLHTHILGMDEGGNNYSIHKAHPDPFLRSMAFWTLKDYESALHTLLEEKPSQHDSKEDSDAVWTKPNIFSFYNYLRTHPLLLRLRLASTSLKQRRAILTGFTRTNSVAVSDKITTIDRVTWRERKLFFATATTHLKNGCPLLALEVMTRLPPTMDTDRDLKHHVTQHTQESVRRGTLIDLSQGSNEADTSLNCGQNAPPVPSAPTSQKAEDFDWGAPVTSQNKADAFDWGTPVASQKADEYDWGAPVMNKVRFDDELELDLKLGSDSEEEEGEGGGEEEGEKDLETKGKGKVTFDKGVKDDDGSDDSLGDSQGPPPESEKRDHKMDIMAQQYKYIACLKVLMEELSTLATGFEVDGGQLRYQLYVWLEKEVEVLKVLCNYGLPEEVSALDADLDTSMEAEEEVGQGSRKRTVSQHSDTSRASLHENILADKYDLDFKERRLARRKRWLRQHQHLLRTLASYCILQGSSGGGLASVHMELLLLLQELQQERAKHQLQSPLPFPTTLPLLSASLASSRTVIADPIQYLQRMSHDLLQAITAYSSPPSASSNMTQVVSMRSLAVSLSSCIYQCLCDSDSFSVNMARAADTNQETFMGGVYVAPNSSLMAGIIRQRHRSETGSSEDRINTLPAKWPGVTSLQCLLVSGKDEDAPKLHVLLCEALLSVYVSLLINGLAMFETQILYRLLANRLDQHTWGTLFGGGCRTALKVEKSIPKLGGDPLSVQRLKLHMKVMGPPREKKEEKDAPVKETYKEKFVPPDLSMITYFMTKPFIQSSNSVIDYDSDDLLESEDELDGDDDLDDDEMDRGRPNTLKLWGQQEHCDPNSYSWCLMRYAIMRAVLLNLRLFLPQVGIELSELPIVSPMLHAVVRLLERWEAMMQARLDLFPGPPDNFINGLTLQVISGKPNSKLEALLSAENTPFVNSPATLPVKRLWLHLVHQKSLQDVFLRYVYKQSHKHISSDEESMRTGSSDEPRLQDPMKVVHKEQEIITSFAVNQPNENSLALATHSKLIELDIGLILHPPAYLTDENEYDIEVLRNALTSTREEKVGEYGENWLLVDVKAHKLDAVWTCTEEVKKVPVHSPLNNVAETMPEFLVVHTPQDTPQPHSGTQTPNTPYLPSPAGSVQGLQTGRGSSVPKLPTKMTMVRALQGVRKIGSHPTLQYYLTGSADGSVRLWEWNHDQPVTTLRHTGSFPKVTKVLFNAQGNKCCVSDVEGSICLWQVGLGSNFNKPIMSLACHNKTTADFAFLGCSSLIATCGYSSENKNVCLWDTLLPPRSALVHAFPCHEFGCPSVVYAPQSQTLISGGRKGDICQFDLRQRKIKNTFQAHDSAIKCLAVDGKEEYYVTGSSEGDIKVWAMNSNQLCFSFPGEHSKNTFFRNVGATSGVTQVAINSTNHLFSCGADGSIKFRHLPEKEVMMHHFI
ncbi:dmX-like protein 2 isoform X2 [Babylonia areolata]|uniref:dmX-like protein 2 isoform X2 n=1 Tax=Babylonia areolata TaxID=304850 RepID=UPI003FD07A30